MTFVCAVLFATHTAQAFYNSSTGRWLSRDPIGELGFALLPRANSDESKGDAEEQKVESGDSGDSRTTVQTCDPLYVMVQNNPENLIDDLGLIVFLQAHPVTLRMNHSKVTMVVECGSRWMDSPHFRPMPGQPGQQYATIGAGPRRRLLFSELNRPRDLQFWRDIFSVMIPPPSGITEDDFIGQLIAADTRYPDNLPYAWFPTGNGQHYNSNGYASGILLFVTDSMPPRPPRTPGFTHPVPSWDFE